MRHALASLGALAVLAASAWGMNLVGMADHGPGTVWVLLPERPAPALARLLARPGVRLVDLKLAGRLAQLHAASLSEALDGEPRLALRMPAVVFALAGCG